jgi:hypothetical protein
MHKQKGVLTGLTSNYHNDYIQRIGKTWHFAMSFTLELALRSRSI